MKLFTYPVKELSNMVFLDCLKELDCKIDSLNQYLTRTNPNWHLLNTRVGSAVFATDKELIDNNIIKLGLLHTKDNKYQIITIICASKLKLHQGLSQIYGNQCYYWFFSDSDWPTRITYQDIPEEIKTDFQKKYQSLTNEGPNNNYEIWVTNDEFSSINYAYLYDGQDSISFKIYDNNDTGISLVLQNHDSKLTIPNDISAQITNPYIPIVALQGYNIFCNYIEENDSQNLYNKGRQNIINYQILPTMVAGDIVVPTMQYVKDSTNGSTDNSTSITWIWQYFTQGIIKYGTNYLFHLPSGPLRLYYHNTNNNFTGLYLLDLTNASNYINSFTIQGSTIVPFIANKNNTIWNGITDQVICSKIIHNVSSDHNIFQEEEIICDESLNIKDTVFANYKIPYYNITIENMVGDQSSIPDMKWYLTMI